MKVVIFRTMAEKARGLQYISPIPPDTLFKFLNVSPGTVFHSRNVTEPFAIFFMNADSQVLKAEVMTPPNDTQEAPSGTAYVLEVKMGMIPV